MTLILRLLILKLLLLLTIIHLTLFSTLLSAISDYMPLDTAIVARNVSISALAIGIVSGRVPSRAVRAVTSDVSLHEA